MNGTPHAGRNNSLQLFQTIKERKNFKNECRKSACTPFFRLVQGKWSFSQKPHTNFSAFPYPTNPCICHFTTSGKIKRGPKGSAPIQKNYSFGFKFFKTLYPKQKIPRTVTTPPSVAIGKNTGLTSKMASAMLIIITGKPRL